MAYTLKPEPGDFLREFDAVKVRSSANGLRKMPPVDIDPPAHHTNGEIENLGSEVPATFTKGLPHNRYGIVDKKAFGHFIDFINQRRTEAPLFSYSDPEGKKIKLGPKNGYNDKKLKKNKKKPRTWESPLAGHVFSLEGADADMLTMPPAPKLGSGELSVEMAEVYGLALLRDVPFTKITAGSGKATDVIDALKGFSWYRTDLADKRADDRRLARLDPDGNLTAQTVFRGSTEGAKKGPYLSQFMLIGNASRGADETGNGMIAMATPGPNRVEPLFSGDEANHSQNICPILVDGEPQKAIDGYIVYGTQFIDQRTSAHAAKQKTATADYLVDWASWIDAQNGANFKGRDVYADNSRFITTPRDLASYVHFDQLYQAYLNACLILLTYNFPFDEGLPEGNGHPVRDAFATFGGPHVLSLVTEVATRALKFARRQKFNIHLRARPEAIAGVLTLAKHGDHARKLGIKARRAAKEALTIFEDAATQSNVDLLERIIEHNTEINEKKGKSSEELGWIKPDRNCLLPMAFPEGSPMHPSYAAGHATVAGACITILKAFFAVFDEIGRDDDGNKIQPEPLNDAHWIERDFITIYGDDDAKREKTIGLPEGALTTGIFAPDDWGKKLEQQDGTENEGIKVLGELEKLAANISIGRNMAGVHYYTDYYESLRMGERLAVSILEEQMLTYPEKVTMRLQTFDGDRMVIEGQGNGMTVDIRIAEEVNDNVWTSLDYKDWFER